MVIKSDLITYITNVMPLRKGYGISKLRKSQSGGLVATQVESYDSSRVNAKWVKIAVDLLQLQRIATFEFADRKNQSKSKCI